MRGSFGLVIGMAIGAGAMYLALRPPWERRAVTVPSHGPAVVTIANDAGVGKPKSKHRRTRTVGNASGEAAETSDPAPEEIAPLPLTAADRALEWRGDDVALPPQEIDMAGGAEARSLDDDEIGAAIRSQAGGVKDCVVQGAAGTDLRATITVKLLVDGRGRVTRSRVQAPHYLFEHGLLGCAQRAAGRIRFRATGGATLVTLPVNLG